MKAVAVFPGEKKELRSHYRVLLATVIMLRFGCWRLVSAARTGRSRHSITAHRRRDRSVPVPDTNPWARWSQ